MDYQQNVSFTLAFPDLDPTAADLVRVVSPPRDSNSTYHSQPFCMSWCNLTLGCGGQGTAHGQACAVQVRYALSALLSATVEIAGVTTTAADPTDPALPAMVVYGVTAVAPSDMSPTLLFENATELVSAAVRKTAAAPHGKAGFLGRKAVPLVSPPRHHAEQRLNIFCQYIHLWMYVVPAADL